MCTSLFFFLCWGWGCYLSYGIVLIENILCFAFTLCFFLPLFLHVLFLLCLTPHHLSLLVVSCVHTLKYAVGMTKLCCLSNITGRKQWQRSSHMNSSGTSIWTRRLETRTISTGLSTSVRFFLHMKNCLLVEI